MRRMNSMLRRAPGRVGAHRLHVFCDGELRRRRRPRTAAGGRCGSAPRCRRRRPSSSSIAASSTSSVCERQRRGCRSGPAASGCRASDRRCPELVELRGASSGHGRGSAARGRARSARIRRAGTCRRRGDRRRAGACRAASRDGDDAVVGAERIVVDRSGRCARGQASRSSSSCAALERCAPRPAISRSKRTLSPGRSWPIFHSSAWTIVTGQTKPPSEGPSGPRMTGMSPVKSTAPMA